MTPLPKLGRPARQQTNLPNPQTVKRNADGEPLLTAREQRAMAEAICKAAAVGRNEISDDAPAEATPLSMRSSLNERMLATEVPTVLPDLPTPQPSPGTNVTARQIAEAGRRRRGEI